METLWSPFVWPFLKSDQQMGLKNRWPTCKTSKQKVYSVRSMGPSKPLAVIYTAPIFDLANAATETNSASELDGCHM